MNPDDTPIRSPGGSGGAAVADPAGRWRQPLRQRLAETFDLLVVGGGITGAGIALEAARRGLKVALVERADFAAGTSSASSKLIHGGLRYLKEGRLWLTRESVLERNALLHDAPGLVAPQSFAFADYADSKPSRRTLGLGLWLYDLISGKRSRRYDPADQFLLYAPHIDRNGLNGGSRFTDAKTDDSRLVLRVLAEAGQHGAVLLNYCAVTGLARDAAGKVVGADVHDAVAGDRFRIAAQVVVNATGAWAAALPGHQDLPTLRPLRGSHLTFPLWRFPVAQAVSFSHPYDGRPVFVYPWEGVALLGTTDLDHPRLDTPPVITAYEVAYLMAAAHYQFPSLELSLDDVIASFAGIRPVIDSGAKDPSKESRDHAVASSPGLVSVTGGKLTTFRAIALSVLRQAARQLPDWRPDWQASPVLSRAGDDERLAGVPSAVRQRLVARYGAAASMVAAAAQPGELESIPASPICWAELRHAARHEHVVHLDDLLLRRTRLGLITPQGGERWLERIGAIVRPELQWDEARWNNEMAAYRTLWEDRHSLPPRATIPDWRRESAAAKAR